MSFAVNVNARRPEGTSPDLPLGVDFGPGDKPKWTKMKGEGLPNKKGKGKNKLMPCGRSKRKTGPKGWPATPRLCSDGAWGDDSVSKPTLLYLTFEQLDAGDSDQLKAWFWGVVQPSNLLEQRTFDRICERAIALKVEL